jgi:hypothetical protein
MGLPADHEMRVGVSLFSIVPSLSPESDLDLVRQDTMALG